MLSQRIAKHAFRSTRDDMLCAERLCLTLSSVLLYKTTHDAMIQCGGLAVIVDLCKAVSEPLLLCALAKVLVPLVPPPDELLVRP